MNAPVSASPRVVIVGGGIVGACTAAWLQRDGHAVTLIDHDRIGMGASYGNGGCFSGSSIIPVAMPGVLSRVPGWLLDSEGPLTIRWRYLPKLVPWLARFVRGATPEGVAAQASALRTLLAPSLANYAPIVRDAGAADLVHHEGMLYLYASDASWRRDEATMRLRRENGVEIEELEGAALAALEPDLAPGLTRGRLVRENGHTSDPLDLVTRLVRHAVDRGAHVVRERVTGFEDNGAAVTAVVTDQGRHPASHVVIAAGAWSKPLAASLGDPVPLDTERGYHAQVKDPERGPRIPTLYVDGNFGAIPMTAGVRLVGTVELAGLEAPPDWRRADVLLAKGRSLYPGLLADGDDSRVSRWLGFRPSMPDSLPVIGPSSRFPNAIHAFGHGHVGMCAGSTTGRVVADLVSGRAPCVPIEPFSARRFR